MNKKQTEYIVRKLDAIEKCLESITNSLNLALEEDHEEPTRFSIEELRNQVCRHVMKWKNESPFNSLWKDEQGRCFTTLDGYNTGFHPDVRTEQLIWACEKAQVPHQNMEGVIFVDTSLESEARQLPETDPIKILQFLVRKCR